MEADDIEDARDAEDALLGRPELLAAELIPRDADTPLLAEEAELARERDADADEKELRDADAEALLALEPEAEIALLDWRSDAEDADGLELRDTEADADGEILLALETEDCRSDADDADAEDAELRALADDADDCAELMEREAEAVDDAEPVREAEDETGTLVQSMPTLFEPTVFPQHSAGVVPVALKSRIKFKNLSGLNPTPLSTRRPSALFAASILEQQNFCFEVHWNAVADADGAEETLLARDEEALAREDKALLEERPDTEETKLLARDADTE
ncbi:hypothetical protein FB45DRAFT_1109121 [Roridomyces roridus]|uniref:Uncharacterized protein n=1 Tax=Roridomyces roridus TaxID=1738132 RepID=A0AAD7BA00_9AGAR|nr:hypothetical protein FB45DRAFT_1109121 [Roridomyces roridus]